VSPHLPQMKNLLLFPSQKFDIPPLSKLPTEQNLKLPNLLRLPPSSFLQNIFYHRTLLPPPSQTQIEIFPIPKFTTINETLLPMNRPLTNHDSFNERIKQEVKCEDALKVKTEEPLDVSCKLEEVIARKTDIKQEYKEDNPLTNKEEEKSQYKKSAQNRIKNLPGLIIQRVRSTIKICLSIENPTERGYTRVLYVEKFLRDMNRKEKDRFLTFLEQYEKRWKTWHSILTFLNRSQEFGLIILEIIAMFLSDPGKQDFEEWLKSGKMCEKSKATILETKDLLAFKFSQIFKNPAVLQESFSGTRLLKKQKTELHIHKYSP